MAGDGSVRAIPAEELRRIQDVALEWAAYNGCPRPRSMRVVLTTRDAAALIIKPVPLRVGSLTLRPAEAAVDIGSLGRVYMLAG